MNKEEFKEIIQIISDKFHRSEDLPRTTTEEFWDKHIGIKEYDFNAIRKAINRFVNTDRGKELIKYKILPEVSDIISNIEKPSPHDNYSQESQEDRETRYAINDIHYYITFKIITINAFDSNKKFDIDISPENAVGKIITMMSEIHDTDNVSLKKDEILLNLWAGIQGKMESGGNEEHLKFLKEVYRILYYKIYPDRQKKSETKVA